MASFVAPEYFMYKVMEKHNPFFFEIVEKLNKRLEPANIYMSIAPAIKGDYTKELVCEACEPHTGRYFLPAFSSESLLGVNDLNDFLDSVEYDIITAFINADKVEKGEITEDELR